MDSLGVLLRLPCGRMHACILASAVADSCVGHSPIPSEAWKPMKARKQPIPEAVAYMLQVSGTQAHKHRLPDVMHLDCQPAGAARPPDAPAVLRTRMSTRHTECLHACQARVYVRTHMFLGISSTSLPLTPVTDRRMKIQPSTKAAARACSYDSFLVPRKPTTL